MRNTLILLMVTTIIFNYSCKKETIAPLVVDFSYVVLDSNFTSPVTISFNNKTSGAALFYKWSFSFGPLATYNEKNPGTLTFTQTGNLKIKLEAWNDTERGVKEIEILLDSLTIAKFNITSRINNIAPVELDCNFTGQGATIFNWQFANGMPANSTLKNPLGI